MAGGYNKKGNSFICVHKPFSPDFCRLWLLPPRGQTKHIDVSQQICQQNAFTWRNNDTICWKNGKLFAATACTVRIFCVYNGGFECFHVLSMLLLCILLFRTQLLCSRRLQFLWSILKMYELWNIRWISALAFKFYNFIALKVAQNGC